MQGELNTEKGLRNFNYGFLVYMCSLVILLVLLIAFLSILPSVISAGDNENIEEMLAPLLGLVAGLCLGIIVMLISLILFLMGLLSLNTGRFEFGQSHSASFQRGLIFVVIGVIVSVFGGITGQVGSGFVGMFTSIMISLGLVFMVHELADEQGKSMLWTGAILYIIISIVNAIVILWLFLIVGLGDITTQQGQVGEDAISDSLSLLIIPVALGSLALIPITIFYLAYRRIYNRIKSRELQPVAMPPPPFAMPYPQGYPPGPPMYPPGGPYQPPPPGYPPSYQQYPSPPQPPYYPGPPQQIGIKPSQGAVSQTKAPVSPVPVEVRRCRFCGTSVPKNAVFCPSCRKAV